MAVQVAALSVVIDQTMAVTERNLASHSIHQVSLSIRRFLEQRRLLSSGALSILGRSIAPAT
jgi:hypothetical protein